MPVIPFNQLADNARIWIFPTFRSLEGDMEKYFLDKINEFFQSWNAHEAPVTCGYEWKYNRFLIIGADETNVAISGCSNDSLFRTVKNLEQELGLRTPMVSPIYYKAGDTVRCVTRDEFRDLIKMGGLIDENTIVFNNIIQTVGEYRQGLWESPMKNSWHIEAFPVKVHH